MDDRSENKPRPSHRVSFSRINGQDRDGNDVLGPSRQIGAIWPRQGKDGEGILRFDHFPEELRSQGGVVFVSRLDALRSSRRESNTKGKDGERER